MGQNRGVSIEFAMTAEGQKQLVDQLQEQLRRERAQHRYNLAEKERELALVLRELAEARLELARRDRIEALQRVGAEEKVDLADRQKDAVVHVRAARNDGDVEAILPVGSVSERLVEAAVFSFCNPTGTKRDFVECLRAGRGRLASFLGTSLDDEERCNEAEPKRSDEACDRHQFTLY